MSNHYSDIVCIVTVQGKNMSVLDVCLVGVVIIDDHPEVTTLEDPQSSTNDDGFTEVVSRKQQKRLQDEERRKKEEQTVQVQVVWSYQCALVAYCL